MHGEEEKHWRFSDKSMFHYGKVCKWGIHKIAFRFRVGYEGYADTAAEAVIIKTGNMRRVPTCNMEEAVSLYPPSYLQ